MTSVQTRLNTHQAKRKTANRSASTLTTSEAGGGRAVTKKSPLPNSRAVVGGLLMAVAALGTFVAYQQSTQTRQTMYLVAGANLGAGHVLQRADLGSVTGNLPSVVAAHSFGDAKLVMGQTLVGPVQRGDLLQQSNLTATAVAPVSFEVPMQVDPGRFPTSLRKGDNVDVLVTMGQGADAKTTVIARAVRIADVGSSNSGALSAAATSIRLVANDEVTETTLANAGAAGKVTLVASNGVAKP